MSYHVDVTPNRNSPPAILFRQAQRDGKRSRRTTLANLSKLPPQIVDGIRAMLRGGQVYRPGEEAFCSRCSLPHGHVAAVLGPVRGNDMLDWLLGRQAWIEKSLARRHLEGATLLLYDVSSSYLEGRCSPLAAFGHNRDGKQQIVFGLLCAADGCPVAVDVFAGNTADPSTGGVQVKKVQQRFGLESIALVGDRGMLTTARLRDDLEPAGLAWISALKTDARRVGRDVSRKKVDKHFAIEVTDAEIRWSRKQDKINAEAQLDGIYVIRTSLQSSALGAPEAVEAYKSLAHVERAFRSLKTAQLAVRPIFVYSEDHVRGHILLCLLAYYVEWHLRRRLAPLLFEEEDRAGVRALWQSPVEKAQVSASTKAKAASKQTPEGLPVHSFQTLLADLGTLTLNEVTLPDAPQHPFPMVAKPTPLQAKAFDLLGVDPSKFVASKLAG